jgi:hypothetical protein
MVIAHLVACFGTIYIDVEINPRKFYLAKLKTMVVLFFRREDNNGVAAVHLLSESLGGSNKREHNMILLSFVSFEEESTSCEAWVYSGRVSQGLSGFGGGVTTGQV